MRKEVRIVKNLLQREGFDVYLYHPRHILSRLFFKIQLKQVKGPAQDYVMDHPDLIIVSEKKESFFVQVLLAKRQISQRQLTAFPHTLAIVVNAKGGIFAQDVDQLKKGVDFEPIQDIKPFTKILPRSLDAVARKLRRTFGKEHLPGQLVERCIERFTSKSFSKDPAYPVGGILKEARSQPAKKRQPARSSSHGTYIKF